MWDARNGAARVNNESRKISAGIALLVLASLLTLSSTHTASAAGAGDDKAVLGFWKHLDDDTGKTQSIFKLFMYEGKLVGKIVKVFPKAGKPAQTVCTECEGRQKNKPISGLIFFWDFVRDEDGPGKWTDGKILNPEDGKTYNATAELSKDGKTLKVFGYIQVLVKLGGTSVWKRPTPEELQGL
jgi:uncharacterized protein (DUF2147 family)